MILGCDRIAPLATRLAVVAEPAAGARLWREHCPAAGTGLVSDGRLATLDIAAKPTAFSWSLIGNSDLSLSIQPSGHGPGKRLLVDGNADVPRPVLAQQVVLAAGSYVLSWRSGEAQGEPSDHILAALSCAGEPPAWAAAALDRSSGLWRAAVAASPACKVQQLTFAAAPHSGQVWLEEVGLVRAR